MNDPTPKSKQLIFNNTYLVKSKLNAGSFGEVFLGKDLQTNENVAIKLEVIKEELPDINRSLLREASILNHLKPLTGIPRILWFGSEHNYDVMIIELLGKDLASILKSYKRLSLGTIILIATKVLTLLQSIHERDVIHRDIKPDNILMGIEEKSEDFYIIDFGISKCYRDPKGHHLVFRENKPFIGTMRYASCNSHMGVELSRRDDLESFGYVLLYLVNGFLPWQNVEAKGKEKGYQVGKIKQKIKVEDLCRDLPKAFHEYFDYIRRLKFNETPDYNFMIGLFKRTAKEMKWNIQKIVLDWRMNKDKIAEFLLGTSPLLHRNKQGKSPSKSGQNSFGILEERKDKDKGLNGTVLSFSSANKSQSSYNNLNINGKSVNGSLNNYYVPTKGYLKEDNYEDSRKIILDTKKEGNSIGLHLSHSDNNSSLNNSFVPTMKNEDKFEDCIDFFYFF